jgi:hypothetical protein
MLTEHGDTDRLVALAVDPARHDRMLDLSGGDADALTEITTAQDLVLGHPEPDLLAVARLSKRRSDLAARNADIPADLPAVWATLGHPARAESLARTITAPYRQARALVAAAGAVAAAGDPTRPGPGRAAGRRGRDDRPHHHRPGRAGADAGRGRPGGGRRRRPGRPGKVPREAAMLAYVSVTRAKRTLDRGGLAWIDDQLAGVVGADRRSRWRGEDDYASSRGDW